MSDRVWKGFFLSEELFYDKRDEEKEEVETNGENHSPLSLLPVSHLNGDRLQCRLLVPILKSKPLSFFYTFLWLFS